MNVLVTGGAGRIGRHVSRLLLERADRVRILALPGDPSAGQLEAEGAEIVWGRLEDRTLVDSAADGVDAVVHLGAALTSRDATDEEFFESNLRGTFNLLQAVRYRTPAVRRFVSASSDAVYWRGPTSPPDSLPVDESHARVPGSIYGATKLAAEELCLTYWRAFGIPTTTVRFSATAEPWELIEPESVFGRRIFVAPAVRAIAGRPEPSPAELALLAELRAIDDGTDRLFVQADPDGRTATTNLSDARDAAAGALCLLDHPAAVGGAFNIGPPKPYDEARLIRHIAGRLGIPWHVIRLQHPRPSWYISSARAIAQIGYVPGRTVFEMVDEALAGRSRPRSTVRPPESQVTA